MLLTRIEYNRIEKKRMISTEQNRIEQNKKNRKEQNDINQKRIEINRI